MRKKLQENPENNEMRHGDVFLTLHGDTDRRAADVRPTCKCLFFYVSHGQVWVLPKPKSSFHHLKQGIKDFHMNYVLVPTDKAANNVVVV